MAPKLTGVIKVFTVENGFVIRLECIIRLVKGE